MGAGGARQSRPARRVFRVPRGLGAQVVKARGISEDARSSFPYAGFRLVRRRGRDLNPRRTKPPETVFETQATLVRNGLLQTTTRRAAAARASLRAGGKPDGNADGFVGRFDGHMRIALFSRGGWDTPPLDQAAPRCRGRGKRSRREQGPCKRNSSSLLAARADRRATHPLKLADCLPTQCRVLRRCR